ncbi:hypothetical protein QBC41DRAFT_113558 [Cercophora samala]|uniref:Uncharacterized protein n=1 Tax=Cercophora samala TaxID=330535 RepID=A0AA39ZDK2_9PEZI|nr:hypothetical protein QBC41DRAFT_113558 [Cercophora samala]
MNMLSGWPKPRMQVSAPSTRAKARTSSDHRRICSSLSSHWLLLSRSRRLPVWTPLRLSSMALAMAANWPASARSWEQNGLSSISAHPTLGIDSILPQYRPNYINVTEQCLLPSHNQHPVLYFAYGTQADPDVLKEKLNLDEEPVYKPARVLGGLLKVWGNKYKAPVDAPPRMDHSKAIIDGYALVENSVHEDALCGYETDKYEVVRCAIELPEEGQLVKGLDICDLSGRQTGASLCPTVCGMMLPARLASPGMCPEMQIRIGPSSAAFLQAQVHEESQRVAAS